jgi:hypothetical protein
MRERLAAVAHLFATILLPVSADAALPSLISASEKLSNFHVAEGHV